MHYWGTLLGIIFSIWIDAGFLGIVLGLIIGHIIDSRYVHKYNRFFFINQHDRKRLFFRRTFQVMGHLSKSKGRVTEEDIQIASSFINSLQLNRELRIAAQKAFFEGKQSSFSLEEALHQLRSICRGRADLIHIFLKIQFRIALADNMLHPNEREILHIISEAMGVMPLQFDQFCNRMKDQNKFGRGQDHGCHQKNFGLGLSGAYNLLGVTSLDDILTIKRAYRKLMNAYHPDKLVSKDLSPKKIKIAKKKAQDIQAAYDLIKQERNFK